MVMSSISITQSISDLSASPQAHSPGGQQGMEHRDLTPGIKHGAGKGKMSPLLGSYGAFLAPQFTRMPLKPTCKP